MHSFVHTWNMENIIILGFGYIDPFIPYLGLLAIFPIYLSYNIILLLLYANVKHTIGWLYF